MPVEVWSHIEPKIVINVLLTAVAHLLLAPIHRRICRDRVALLGGRWLEGGQVMWL